MSNTSLINNSLVRKMSCVLLLIYNLDGDITNGSNAFIVNDMYGNSMVDLTDLVKIDENLTNGVVVMTP